MRHDQVVFSPARTSPEGLQVQGLSADLCLCIQPQQGPDNTNNLNLIMMLLLNGAVWTDPGRE